jgi:hypothetical protein
MKDIVLGRIDLDLDLTMTQLAMKDTDLDPHIQMVRVGYWPKTFLTKLATAAGVRSC